MKTYTNLIQKEKYFNCVTVETLEELRNEINKYLGKTNYIFRGTNEAKFMMYTSAQRILHHSNQDSFFYDINERIQRLLQKTDLIEYFVSKEIPINDILLLGLLQHFQSPSPLLDFTHDINTALFFATDGLTMPSGEKKGIEEYFSIYIIDRTNQFFCSLQEVMYNGACSIRKMISESEIPIRKEQASKVLDEFKNLSYYQYKEIKYIMILGEEGKISIHIPIFDFSCTYYITNPHLHSQSGLFILNNTYDEPLEKLIENFIANSRPSVNCINIHKSLYQSVVDNYLLPNGICSDKIYPQNNDTKNIKQWLREIGL